MQRTYTITENSTEMGCPELGFMSKGSIDMDDLDSEYRAFVEKRGHKVVDLTRLGQITVETPGFEHEVAKENAKKFWDWIKDRGGVAVWRSVDLSDPGQSWSTPRMTATGEAASPPTWRASAAPDKVITNPANIGVYDRELVRTIRVGIERGSELSWVLTAAASDRLRLALRLIGDGAFYEFSLDDNGRRVAVLYRSVPLGSLADYARKEGWT